MIEVKNLSHYYSTKYENMVVALDDVSLKLADSGMYYIVGKSGCGKSTFLNLLGGLDKISDGDIIVDGVSMKEFSQSDYDAYRASYVGIIFQEFNLLEDLTVFQNIEFQLNLAGINVTKEIIQDSLQKVGLKGYANRYPYQLSGGERQRVAIARQLAKGVKLLLADEPTGNLDSENAENIFCLLKSLSSEITVLVVSHDTESAEKYADSIIMIKDGCIERIIEKKIKESGENKPRYKSNKPRFPLKYILLFARKNIFKKKIRFSVAALLSIVAIFMFFVIGSAINYDAERSYAERLLNDKVEYFSLYQKYNPLTNDYGTLYRDKLTRKFLGEFSEKYSDSKFCTIRSGGSKYQLDFKGGKISYQSLGVTVISSADDIVNVLGYKMLEGYLPLDSESAYITDFYANGILSNDSQYMAGEEITLLPRDYEMADLVGLTLYKDEATIKVAGIILTDSDNYEYVDGNGVAVQFQGGDYNEAYQKKYQVYNSLYVNEDGFKEYVKNMSIQTLGSMSSSLNGMDVHGFWLGKLSDGNFGVSVKLITDTQELSLRETVLSNEKNEIILSLPAYNEAFQENARASDFYNITKDSFGKDIVTFKNNYVKHIGETVKYQIVDWDGIVVHSDEFVFKGVYINTLPKISAETLFRAYINDESFVNASYNFNRRYERLYVSSDNFNKESLMEMLKYARQYNVYVESEYEFALYSLEDSFSKDQALLIIIASVFLLISLLIFSNYIASTISDRKKDIGIIKALGGTSAGVFKSYYFLSIIFWLITSILSIALYCVLLPVFNDLYATEVLAGSTVLYFSPLVCVIVCLISLLVMSIASVLPIIMVSRKSPIDCIKQ